MLKLHLIEILLRGIPEGFLYIFAGYAMSKRVVDLKRCSLSTLILAVMLYITRALPISFGIHTIILIIVAVVLMASVNKIPIVSAVPAMIIAIAIEFMSEGLNIAFIKYCLGLDVNEVFKHPVLKSVLGIPSLVILGGIIGLYYLRLHKRNELKHV